MKPAIALVLCLLAISLPAQGSEYPERSVRVVVPYPPGGSFDGPSRLIAAKLATIAGKNFVVENRGGAGGNIAAIEVQRAPADGYTVLISSGALSISSSLAKKAPFDAAKDFTHIATFATLPVVLVANAKNMPYQSLPDLIAASKAAPGKFTYASAGSGSAGHLATEMIKEAFGVDWVHIPYKGTGPALNDLLGGQVDLSVIGLSSAVPQLRGGKLSMFGVTSSTPVSQLPRVPTIAEYKTGFEFEMWLGFAMPRSTPPQIVSRFTLLVEQALKDPELLTQLAQAGVKPSFSTGQETVSRVLKETETFGRLGRRLKIDLEY